MLNTEKGQKLFDAVKERMNVIPAELDNCMQPNLKYPSIIHSKRIQFENDYAKKGFEYVYFKYGEEGWRHKIWSLLRNLKKQMIRIFR